MEDSFSTVGEGVTLPLIKRPTESGLSFGKEQVKNVLPGVRTKTYYRAYHVAQMFITSY